MNTQKITTEYRMSRWTEIIKREVKSGKSINDFCIDEDINRNTYFYWQRKLREAACTKLVTQEVFGR